MGARPGAYRAGASAPPAPPPIRAADSRPPGRGLPTAETRLVRVDQLADRRDLPPELVVDLHFARDLAAGVEDRGVVPPSELGADPQQRCVRLLAHEEHRDLPRNPDR